MTINVIHDPRRQDRRILLESEIREHGLDVRYWNAIMDPQKSFRGISRAHKQIVRWAMTSKLPNVCIAEDDLHLVGPGAWTYFVDHIPNDYDLYLSGIYCGTIRPGNTTDDFCALHLYIVHERFYARFLGVNEDANLDRELAKMGRYVVCNPFAAVQHDGYSDNKKIFAKYGHHLKNRQLCCQTT